MVRMVTAGRVQRRGRRALTLLALSVLIVASVVACGASGPGSPPGGQIILTGFSLKITGVHGDGTHAETLAGQSLAGEPGDISAVSPQGDRLAVSESACPPGGLYMGDRSGSAKLREVWPFPKGAVTSGQLAWSPDGRRLALPLAPYSYRGEPLLDRSASGLWVVGRDGSRPQHLDSDANGPVAWSPDGSRIVYTVIVPDTEIRLLTTSPSGGPSTLVETIPWSPSQPDDQGVDMPPQFEVWLAWSPGPDLLVDTLTIPDTANTGRISSNVTAYPPAGGPGKVLLPAAFYTAYTGAVYSPDGKRVAAAMPNQSAIRVANADGTDARTFRTLEQTNDTTSQLTWISGLHLSLKGASVPYRRCDG